MDTHPDAERAQIALIRKASVAERISRMRSLSRSVIHLSRKAIGRANPGFNEREIALAFISHCYGSALADRLRDYLDKPPHESS